MKSLMYSFNEEDIETLVNLGLSSNQAKIYLILLSSGYISAKKITQITQMDSGDVYRRLEILIEKGLVEKILHNPTEFKAIPLRDAVKVLVEPKNKEYDEMQKRINVLLKKEIEPINVAIKEDFSLLIIPRNETRKQYIYRTNKKVKQEWIVYTQIGRIPIAINGYYDTNRKLMDRGIKFRTILELNKPTKEIVNYIQEHKHPNEEIRYTDTNLNISFGICDKREMNFSIQELKGLADSQVLVTDNPKLVKVIYDYFELRWEMAMKEYPKKEN